MRRALSALLVLTLIGVPAQASDFSALAKPEFARFLLLPAKRQRQLECAGLALYLADHGGKPKKAAARRLADEVTQRLTRDLGDAALAKDMVEGKAAGHADPTRTEPIYAKTREYLAERCADLFANAEKGGAELSADLGPLPLRPIELPSAEQCLAVAMRADELGDHQGRRMLAGLRAARLDNAPAAERAARSAVVESGVDMLRKLSVDGDVLDAMSMACIPTSLEAVKDLPREFWGEDEQ